MKYMDGKRDAYFINGDAHCTEEQLEEAENDRALLVDVFRVPYKEVRLMSAEEAKVRVDEETRAMEEHHNITDKQFDTAETYGAMAEAELPAVDDSSLFESEDTRNIDDIS